VQHFQIVAVGLELSSTRNCPTMERVNQDPHQKL